MSYLMCSTWSTEKGLHTKEWALSRETTMMRKHPVTNDNGKTFHPEFKKNKETSSVTEIKFAIGSLVNICGRAISPISHYRKKRKALIF